MRRRRDVWAAALADAGLPRGRCQYTDFSAAAGARVTQRLCRLEHPPTAIVYGNDVMAIAGLAVLQRNGRAVPDEVSVTGFDDTELSQYVQPPLTTVRTDVTGWGERAAAALLDTIGGAPPEHIELAPAGIVARSSIAPPPPTEKRPRR